MSETDSQRMTLLGVGPHSRSLKFLNTKNNIASLMLKKQLALIERQKTFNMNGMEMEKLDTQDFLKHVRKLEHDTKEAKRLLGKDSDSSRATTPPTSRNIRRRRKIRLAQTAPANMKHTSNDLPTKPIQNERKLKSGPETQEEKDHLIKMDRKKSMFLQLSGRSRQNVDDDDDGFSPKYSRLPKPNPKTLLDVMMGLNAFSHVPPPKGSSSFNEDNRAESGSSYFDNESTIYDSTENIAKSFMLQWQKKVANRKMSIIQHLEAPTPQPHRSESIALSSVAEESLSSQLKKRRSKWSLRHSMHTPSLPAISDDDERKEQFLAWVKEESKKVKVDVVVDDNDDDEDEDVFGDSNIKKVRQLEKRRKSFAVWMKSRQDARKDDSSDEEENLGYSGRFGDIPEEDEGPADIGDLMKTILKIKTKFKDPIDARIKRFNNDLQKIKERDDAIRNKPMSNEQKRKWKLLMQGIDVALADSSDEDDNYYGGALY